MKYILLNRLQKKLVTKILFVSTLASVSISVVNAGQSVATFYGLEQKSRPNSRLVWMNEKEEFLALDTPLSLEQGNASYYYLYADTPNYVISVAAGMEILDNNNNKVDDIMIGPADIYNSHTCNFKRKGKGWACKLKFMASENSPLGNNNARKIRSYQLNNEGADSDFHDISKSIAISLPTEIGTIEGFGPDNNPNKLTAIAVSDKSTQDNVPLTFKIKKANLIVKSVTLKFEFEDKDIANTNGAQRGECKIEEITDQTGSCQIYVTPEKIGKTKIKLLATSSWKDNNDNEYKLNLNQYQPVEVNVGTLFAAYNSNSFDRKVYRKGSEINHIYSDKDEDKSVIRGLAVDEPQHKLYMITKSNAYTQSNVTNSDLKLSYLLKIAGEKAQTLSLTDTPNRILVGSGDTNLYGIDTKNSGINVIAKTSASIIQASLDPVNNVQYFIDDNGRISAYYSNWGTSKKYKYKAMSKVLENLLDYHIAAYHDKVYAAGSIPGSGSTLFTWDESNSSNLMSQVIIDENTHNPFESQQIASLFFTRQDELYACRSDGYLYKLEDNPESNTSQWKFIAHTGSIDPTDNAVDANGNIYLSSEDGIWKVPFDKQNTPYKLDGYKKNISAIAIDNNRDTN